MQAVIASTTNFNGRWRVLDVNKDNDTIDILTNGIPSSKAQTAVAGTCTPSGIIRETYVKFLDCEPVMNNNEEIIGYSYTDDCSYLLSIPAKKMDHIYQLINLDAAVACSMTAKMSVDKVHWVDFPATISSGSIAAGSSYVFVIEQDYSDCWVLIEVTCTSGEFMLITR